MIQLTNETKTIEKDSKNFKKGDIIDNSLYLERLDSNNLVLRRGDNIENYFGDVRTALYRSLNYAIKGSDTALSLESILQTIKSMDETIKRLDRESM